MQGICFKILAGLMISAIQGASYNYAQNGADWPSSSSACADPEQSPIDLSRTYSKYPNKKASDDQYNKMYTDQTTNIQILWKDDHTTQVAVNKAG